MPTTTAVLLILVAIAAASPSAAEPLTISGLPVPLEWKGRPASFRQDERGLTIVSRGRTDWFVSPVDGQASASAPLLLFEPATDFVLSARVKVDFRSKWDAGALFAYVDDTTWVKFALEQSAYMEPTIVSVVTRGVSDDCNSSVIAGDTAYLQLARSGSALLLYRSADGRAWKLVRTFSLGTTKPLRVGFEVQSPVGEGGEAQFSEIRYERRKIEDIFAGR
jgi:regulation of enolase protein 1 (concanavalin A-like superfamily)